MSVSLRKKKTKRGVSLYLDCYQHGKRWYEFLGITLTGKDKAHDRELKLLAESIQSKRQLELNSGAHGFATKHLARSDFFVYAERFIQRLAALKKATKTHNAALVAFREYYGNGVLQFRSITQETLSGYRFFLETKFTGETPHNYFRRIRNMLRVAVDEGFMTADPSKGVRNTSNTTGTLRKQFLNNDELRKLEETYCGNALVKRAFLFACNTGLRLSDVLSLRWVDVDLSRGEVVYTQAKTKRVNKVPLNKSALEYLGNDTATSHIFPLNVSTNGINKTIRNWCKRAGVEKHITFHCARHTFISSVLTATGNIKIASALAGHSSVAITERYAHLLDESKRDAVNKIHDASGK